MLGPAVLPRSAVTAGSVNVKLLLHLVDLTQLDCGRYVELNPGGVEHL